MVRHTNTWMFNIIEENWDTCVSGPQKASIHGEKNVGNPVQGIRADAPAPTDDVHSGDLAFARKKGRGIGGIWEVRKVVSIGDDQARSLWDDETYSHIIYCTPIQRELEHFYEEDWGAFSDEFGESIRTVTANIMGAVHNLKPEYKKKYIYELLSHDGISQAATTRLQEEVEELSSHWKMVKKKRELAQRFVEEPSQEAFEALLNPDHFFSQLDRMYEYDMGEIFDRHSLAEIADTIERARETSSPELLNELHQFGWAKTTELLQAIDPDTYAILNDRAEAGMKALGYEPPSRDSATPKEYSEFVNNVREAVDEFNLRSAARDLDIEEWIPNWATELEVADYFFSQNFKGTIDLKELTENGGKSRNCTASSKTAPYYLVKQTKNKEEIESEYLQAPADSVPDHDLGKLMTGDIVFNYTDAKVVGYSTVEEKAQSIAVDGDEFCRVEVDFTRFTQPLRFAEIFETLVKPEYRLDKYYPLHDEGINQGYLFNLSTAAGEFLLEAGTDAVPQTPHELLRHYNSTSGATVWQYTSGPSDWLTILRRGALQFWKDAKSQWEQVAKGDIVLFHVKTSDDKNKALPAYDLESSGFIGLGVIGGKRTKTERWWWNEADSLVYPYLLDLETTYVTIDIDSLDRSRALFQLDTDEIRAEASHLATNIIQWDEASDLAHKTTGKQLPAQGSFSNLSQSRSNLTEFLDQYIAIPGNPLQKIGFEERESLVSMLPSNNKPDQANEVRRRLENVGQVVFHGPPGTGKTYTAMRFARWWIHQQTSRPAETRIRTVTFHPSFAYEDFMEGLAARTNEYNQVTYEYEPGIFKKIYRDARAAFEAADEDEAAPRYILVIDEINRGNLAQIFGEIITQLEMDKRLGGDEAITLEWAHSGDPVAVPPNLYLIGTMNTADRSIALIDAALRRRFSFHSFPPDTSVIIQKYEQFESRAKLLELASDSQIRFDTLLARSVRAVEAINYNIITESDLTRGKRIGHSYLLGLDDIQDIEDAWQFEILPLLGEYYFGDFTRLRREVFEDNRDETGPALITNNLFDVATGEIASFTYEDLDEGLVDLIQRHDFSQHDP